MATRIIEARRLAEDLLAAELPTRHAHVIAVGSKPAVFIEGSAESETLSVAGHLHDIGYASTIQDTGFHPIDGARHLASLDFDPRVVNLVAYHSCARIEAEVRGLAKIQAQEFPYDPSLPHDALCYCDLTTTPDGKPTTAEDRLDEVLKRYGPGSIVYDAVTKARPEMMAAVRRTQQKYGLA